jgi:NAD(P)-dependent dehydrogenase (short-subunit alcohol dehydrogenase family)
MRGAFLTSVKNLEDRVVVITGASSGLGRATAIDLAGRGCKLVLAARDTEALEDTARQCEGAMIVETDVTSMAEVQKLADATMAAFGRIDVWINNAGVTLYGFLEDAPLEEHERVIETNLYGAIYGARAVIPIFRAQHRGTLINVGSVLSNVGQAYVPSYVISKFGVHGLTEALRVELADERDIHICTVFPYAIDTPHFQSAANYIGHEPRALPPTQSPETVARAIAGLIAKPRRTRFVPRTIRLGILAHALMPRTTERLLLDTLRRWHIGKEREQIGSGNLYEPGDTGKRHGDRPPQISLPGLALWCAGRLVKISAENVTHALRSLITPRKELSHA